MKLIALAGQTGEWLRGAGPESEIVLSSRIRLARNLADQPFPEWAAPAQRRAVLETVEAAVGRSKFLKNALVLRMSDLSEMEQLFLVERHLISRDHARQPEGKGVVISDREILSIMINEEDHLRLQVLQSGLNLSEAWAMLRRIDEELEKELPLAFDSVWGYLTACPTNVGTGMRVSAMLHLPCLVMTRQINRVIHAITKLGLTARGFYGEGTEASGNFFQLSNQVSIGVGEEELLDSLGRIVTQVVGQERAARQALIGHSKAALEDRVFRALGTLKSAQLISSQEAIDRLSMVRLGVDLGLIPTLQREGVNRLLVQIQPAHLQMLEGRVLTPAERDARRARLLRESLSAS
ncbi:MAG: protein arginine kinase [Candidatus Omnitrophica bacterium CG11_big_fil_rev_8_21_14_0_20_64_10]|nr:MAG: protein arginine kinase [Candidatus Omnitrophica bacterium CG11_big_fil_rev_8_21_14_0_20_64_10]